MNKSIDMLNKEDTYSMMLLLLYLSSDNPRYSTLSELAYVLDHDSFIKFLKYYEGQTIKIPSIQEVMTSLKLLMLFQYHDVEKIPWKESLDKVGISEADSWGYKHRLDKFKRNLEKNGYKLGGLIYKGDDS